MKKYINLEDMINQNCSNVLDVIRENVCISRKQITELTGLSWGGMTKIVNKLLEHGYIIEEKFDSQSKIGRVPGVLRINKQKNFVIGLDINKIGFRAVVMNLAGEVLKEYSSKGALNNKAEILDEIIRFISSIFDDFQAGSIISIGVAMQGIVDSKQGISVKFPDVYDWNDVPIKSILEDRFHVNVFVEHDPDCLLYPYINSDKENILLLRLDNSIGMSVSLGGRVLKTKGIFEVSHNIVVPGGKKCACGLSGCIEAYILPCLASGEISSKALDELMPILAVVIKNMTDLFNTDKVILTGDLVKYHGMFESELLKKLSDINCSVRVEFSKDNSAVLGAALISVRKSISKIII